MDEAKTNAKINKLLNGTTPYFRLITPVLSAIIFVFGWLINAQITDLKETLADLHRKIDRNTEIVISMKVEYEKRLSVLETAANIMEKERWQNRR